MRQLISLIVILWLAENLQAQQPATDITTDSLAMNKDAVYNRPFLLEGTAPVALGGYVEVNSHFMATEGITDGLSFQMRRTTLFLASHISDRLRFLAELEFEGGTREIHIEFASADLELHPLLQLRAGILLVPIGAFNQNHDGPNWAFTERPLSATHLLPATWSTVGMGLHGKQVASNWALAYEVYLSNGFNDAILSNSEDRTFLPAAKEDPDRFLVQPSGKAMLSAKAAGRHKALGELGLSYMGGVYNTFRVDGVIVDDARRVDVAAIDYNHTLPGWGTKIVGEAAMVWVQVPAVYAPQYGSRQWGAFVDVVQPVWRKPLPGFPGSEVQVAVRLDYVDWNLDKLADTDSPIADDVVRLSGALCWRPSVQSVLRLNYGYAWQRDFLGNPAVHSAMWQLGLATYF